MIALDEHVAPARLIVRVVAGSTFNFALGQDDLAFAQYRGEGPVVSIEGGIVNADRMIGAAVAG